MTVVAWDGKILAADKMVSFGGLFAKTTKITRVGDFLLGGCGSSAMLNELMHWWIAGAYPVKFPNSHRDYKESPTLLVIGHDMIRQYENTPSPINIESYQWAIGSGRDFAMMAMHLGHNAEYAVMATSRLCNDCGCGVDTLELERKK